MEEITRISQNSKKESDTYYSCDNCIASRFSASFALVKDEKILFVSKYYEKLEYFVEELKRLNPKHVDRRKFKIKSGDEIFKKWERK